MPNDLRVLKMVTVIFIFYILSIDKNMENL